jgi:hypothetical protein
MRSFLAALLLASPAAAQTPAPDSATFITRLGADTLVVERVVQRGRRIEADVLLRVPRTTRTHYVLELSPAGELVSMETARNGFQQTITRAGDSLRIVVVTDSGRFERAVAADRRTLPFIDMVHWPYEAAVMRMRSGPPAVGEQRIPLLTGQRTGEFVFTPIGADSITITHPSRGTMRARVDQRGRLLGLDAGATTRKLIVERRPWMVIDGLATRWQADDAAGRSVGALSGRGAAKAAIAGANLTADYGTPATRGREIWGGLVPYGQVWRTGANQATHFTTDRPLVLGEGARALAVPAGRYTLFSIPDANGGVLIVSRDTGQAGTAYDPTKDLGRVPLTARALGEPVELFTIAFGERGAGGEVRLQWAQRELVVPFRVVSSTP